MKNVLAMRDFPDYATWFEALQADTALFSRFSHFHSWDFDKFFLCESIYVIKIFFFKFFTLGYGIRNRVNRK